jgi:hypothetical protein
MQRILRRIVFAILTVAVIAGARAATAQCLCSGKCYYDWTQDSWYCGFGFAVCQTCTDQIGICVERDCGRGGLLIPGKAISPANPERWACNAPSKTAFETKVEVVALLVIPKRT